MRAIVRMVCCGLLMGLSVCCGAQPTVVREYKVPMVGSDNVFRPRISGDWIMINRIGQANTPVLSVDMYNLKTREILTPLNNGKLPWCEFASNQIIYSNGSNIVLYDVITRTQRQIAVANGPADQYAPVVWSHYVAYKGANSQIYLLDTTSGMERMVSNGVDINTSPDIDRNVAVWYNKTAESICGYNIATGQALNIGQQATDLALPRTDGKSIACTSKTAGVQVYNISTNTWTSAASSGYNCDVDGDIVVYQRTNSVYGYDMSTGNTFKISNTPTVNNGPSIEGSRVIWGTQDSVYCAELSLQ